MNREFVLKTPPLRLLRFPKERPSRACGCHSHPGTVAHLKPARMALFSIGANTRHSLGRVILCDKAGWGDALGAYFPETPGTR